MKIMNPKYGKTVLSPKGYSFYVPNPLPPVIDWNSELINSLERANLAIGELVRAGDKLPNAKLFMDNFTIREAVLSNEIEGIHTTIREVLFSTVGVKTKSNNSNSLKEVQNYISALNFGIERLKDLPLSLRLIREIHSKLMEGVRGDYATPGQFRTTQNWIGPFGSDLTNATYVPPNVENMHECLDELELFLHDRTLSPLITAGLFHYQFEAIHPFVDGNGRIGRLMIVLILMERGILKSPLLHLSAFIEATRSYYYKHLLSISKDGSWHDWLVYFCNGITLQAKDTLRRIDRINGLLDIWSSNINKKDVVALNIIKMLASNPYLTTKKVKENLNVAYTTAERGIKKLLDKNIIKKTNNYTRNKSYCATEILSIMEEPARLNLYDFDI